MEKSLDYYEKKQYQTWIAWALLWVSGFPVFLTEIDHFVSQSLWLNITHKLILGALLIILLINSVKIFPLMTNKNLRKQLFDEYAKENHYKVLKISSITGFVLTYVFYYFESLHFLSIKNILGIILYCIGVTLFGGLIILNRK
ncbi:MAG: hypothetical protein GY827_08780 [Cytophagales bacterium]|nr:hypothetical protein [Cytophagales bacterium]